MENQDIARGLLSRLMGVEVVTLEPQAQELTQHVAQVLASEERTIRLFRVDFTAVIRLADGSEQRVLIELQKAHSSDVLGRFRQYLGSHYAKSAKVCEPMPIVAIYLLGFVINDALPKVLKVRRKLLNGVTGDELPAGTRERFVEMLTHDAVIVQIPKLDDSDDTELERALSVFDQRHKDRENPHYLRVDESESGDPLVEKMLRTLLAAVSDDETRREMGMEDELENVFKEHADAKAAAVSAISQAHEERRQKEEERRQKEEANERADAATKRVAELEAMLEQLKGK